MACVSFGALENPTWLLTVDVRVRKRVRAQGEIFSVGFPRASHPLPVWRKARPWSWLKALWSRLAALPSPYGDVGLSTTPAWTAPELS